MRSLVYHGESIKLSKYFSSTMKDISYSSMQKLFRNGDIKINGIRQKMDAIINDGDELVIYFNPIFTEFKPTVVYQDDNIVVYNKPPKIASQGENSFEERIKKHVDKDYILCHRLDTNTRGLLIFAKNKRVFDEMYQAFAKKKIEKHYFAAIYGDFEKKAVLTDYLLKDVENAKVKIFTQKVENSEKIITEVTPILRTGKITYVDVMLVTGKTHQIRAHLAYRGYPVIGDGKYGKESINRAFKAKFQYLFAYKLTFHIEDGLLKYLNNKEIELNNSEMPKF